MIDQIFDETFDSLDDNVKQDILDYYSHGDIKSAYKVWLRHHDK